MRRSIAVMVGSLMLLGACGDDTSGDGSAEVSVVAAFYPLAEVASKVGGDRVDVSNLTSVGAEPHDLELTTDQVDAIEDADVVLMMGNGFQPAVEETADRRDDGTVAVLGELPIDSEGKVVEEDEHEGEEGEEVEGEEEDEHEGEEGAGGGETLDPHVWLDPVLMANLVEVVTDALVVADPDGSATYEANADALLAELTDLDDAFTTGLADCERRTMVTAHDAFGYLAARYDLTQEPIAGISPDEEPNPERLAELSDLAEAEGVTTIFTEELVSPEIAETLAREAGGLETAVLNPLEGLTDEQLDAGEDYISVMETNLATLREALGCT